MSLEFINNYTWTNKQSSTELTADVLKEVANSFSDKLEKAFLNALSSSAEAESRGVKLMKNKYLPDGEVIIIVGEKMFDEIVKSTKEDANG